MTAIEQVWTPLSVAGAGDTASRAPSRFPCAGNYLAPRTAILATTQSADVAFSPSASRETRFGWCSPRFTPAPVFSRREQPALHGLAGRCLACTIPAVNVRNARLAMQTNLKSRPRLSGRPRAAGEPQSTSIPLAITHDGFRAGGPLHGSMTDVCAFTPLRLYVRDDCRSSTQSSQIKADASGVCLRVPWVTRRTHPRGHILRLVGLCMVLTAWRMAESLPLPLRLKRLPTMQTLTRRVTTTGWPRLAPATGSRRDRAFAGYLARRILRRAACLLTPEALPASPAN